MTLTPQMEELVEARKAAAFVFESDEQYALATDILAGRQDYISQVQAALMAYTAGLRAGREEAALVALTWQDAAFATDHENRTYADIATAIRSISEQEKSRG